MDEEELRRRAEPAITLMIVGLVLFVVPMVVTIVPSRSLGSGQLALAAVWLFACGAVWLWLLKRREPDTHRARDDP